MAWDIDSQDHMFYVWLGSQEEKGMSPGEIDFWVSFYWDLRDRLRNRWS